MEPAGGGRLECMPSVERTKWVAGLPFSSSRSLAGRLSMVGGTLHLTNDAVTFEPLAGPGRRRTVALNEIEAIDAYADKPPRLRITLRDGKPLVFIVLANRSSSIRSTDTSARDAALEAIRAAVT